MKAFQGALKLLLSSTAFFSFAHSDSDASRRIQAQRMFPVMTKTDGVRSRGNNCKCRAPQPKSWSGIDGFPVVGENVGDRFGTSVAVSGDGTTIAVGAPWTDGRVGSVYVFTYDRGNSQWKPHGQILHGDVSDDYNYGYNVRLSKDGSILAIAGAGSNHIGRVCVHKYDSAEIKWKPMGECLGEELFTRLSSVSLSDDGETLAVGDMGTSEGEAKATVYKYTEDSGSQRWDSIGVLVGQTGSYSIYGASVSLSQDGSYVAFGEPGEDLLSSPGRVSIWHYVGETWEIVFRLDGAIDVDGGADRFGNSVSLKTDSSGNVRVAIGASKHNNGMGYVSVFRISPVGDSDYEAEPLGENIMRQVAGEEFGQSVSLSEDGNTIAIGAHVLDAGLAFIYKFDGSEWEQEKVLEKVLGEGIEGMHQFGFSVSLSYDGTIVAVGAPDARRSSVYPGLVSAYEFA